MISKYIKSLKQPETTGRKIGLFRIICSIFGGLITGYLFMILVALLIPTKIEEAAVVSIMLNTLAWSAFAVYIALSYTKLNALLRFLIPSIIFALCIYFLK